MLVALTRLIGLITHFKGIKPPDGSISGDCRDDIVSLLEELVTLRQAVAWRDAIKDPPLIPLNDIVFRTSSHGGIVIVNHDGKQFWAKAAEGRPEYPIDVSPGDLWIAPPPPGQIEKLGDMIGLIRGLRSGKIVATKTPPLTCAKCRQKSLSKIAVLPGGEWEFSCTTEGSGSVGAIVCGKANPYYITVDGQRVLAGDLVWLKPGDYPYGPKDEAVSLILEDCGNGAFVAWGGPQYDAMTVNECYSSQEAARAAGVSTP